jgi:hypothetical protein
LVEKRIDGIAQSAFNGIDKRFFGVVFIDGPKNNLRVLLKELGRDRPLEDNFLAVRGIVFARVGCADMGAGHIGGIDRDLSQ